MTDVKDMQLPPVPRPRKSLDLAVPSTPANSFITDIALWFARENGDWLSSATWVSLLTTLGIPASNARTALHRMTKASYLERRRADGKPGYALSPWWIVWIQWMLYEDPLEGNDETTAWTLLTFSVPETRRAERHAIRTILARLGFASLGNGVWIASARRQPEVRAVLETAGLDGYVDLFQAEYTGFTDVAELVQRCWDIDALGRAYRAFVGEARRRLKNGPGADARTFADLVVTNNQWRRIEFTDPSLPRSALPADWPRPEARRLRDELIDRFLGPAREYVASL